MKEILPEVEAWREAGEKVVVATVVATRRSAPRPVGTSLAVSESGKMCGSVSGGCVESDVYDNAMEVMRTGEPKLLHYGITDDMAWEVGLPCGGEIDVYVARADASLLRDAVAELERGRVVTVEPADGGLTLVSRPPPRLVVVGAVDVAEPLCRGARSLGWRTSVVDPRPRFATAERVPSADELLVEWPDVGLSQLAPDEGTAVVVLAHEDRIDLPALQSALASEAFYVGAIGSRRTQGRRREALLELGVSEDALARLHGPVGLDIGAQTPAETAVAILAEILAVRAGRTGAPLRDRDGRIHAAV